MLLVMMLTRLFLMLICFFPQLLCCLLLFFLYIKLESSLMAVISFCCLLCCLSLSFALPGRAMIKALALSLVCYLAPALLSPQYSGNHVVKTISNYTFLLQDPLSGGNEEWHLPLLQDRSFHPCCNGPSVSLTSQFTQKVVLAFAPTLILAFLKADQIFTEATNSWVARNVGEFGQVPRAVFISRGLGLHSRRRGILLN